MQSGSADYADISELDDVAWQLRKVWEITVNYAATLARRIEELRELEDQFAAGKYGPEWTFSRWLIVKCGVSRTTCYRLIRDLHRTASEDQREKVRRALEDERRIKAQRVTDRRATQMAYDEWRIEEKRRIDADATAARKTAAAEPRKASRRERNQRYQQRLKTRLAPQPVPNVGLNRLQDAVAAYALTGDIDELVRKIVASLAPVRADEFLDAVRRYVELKRAAIDRVGPSLGLH